jgi:hypothetical protein
MDMIVVVQIRLRRRADRMSWSELGGAMDGGAHFHCFHKPPLKGGIRCKLSKETGQEGHDDGKAGHEEVHFFRFLLDETFVVELPGIYNHTLP